MNLLPEKIKSEIRVEYYKRLITVGALLCSVLLFLGLVPLLMLYISTTYQIVFLSHEISTIEQTNKKNKVDINLATIKDLNNKLSILNESTFLGKEGRFHDILLSIIDSARTLASSNGITRVHITSFSYSPVAVKKGSTKTMSYIISIGGVADSREVLLKFVKKLETDKTFMAVDLPISNLVENKNPTFSISLTLAKK